MEGVETKPESQEQDSQITSANVEGFEERVKEILNLMREDENFYEMTVEIYASKKDKLTELTTELSRMYGALADENQRSLKDVKTEHADSSINKDALKVKEKKAIHDPKALLKKISNLEKEAQILKKKIRDLTDENAILEADKANAIELKEMLNKANRKIETMGNVLEGSRKQLQTSDRVNFELRQELTTKAINLNEKVRTLGILFDEEEARNLALQGQVSLAIAETGKRDEEIVELKAQIELLKLAHAAEGERLNADIEKLNTELEEKCDLVDELTLKHDSLMRYTMANMGR